MKLIEWKSDNDEHQTIEIRRDGTIRITVNDDWYSGEIDKAQTRELYEALKVLYDVIQEVSV